MKKLLFVCLGNICRSPIAEATFKSLVAQKGLQHQFEADSAGTMGWHTGDLPDRRTRKNAESHGIKLTHQARKISVTDFDTFDHIVAMDQQNFEDVYALYYETKGHVPAAKKLFLLRDHDPSRGDAANIPDPYYESEAAFEEVFQLVWRCNEHLIDFLLQDPT